MTVGNPSLGYSVNVTRTTEQAGGMSRETKTLPIWQVPPRVKRDFAGVRGLVRRAVEASPRSVTLSEAVKQVRLFSQAASKK